MKVENAMAVRTAIEKERADCMTKLDNELKLAKEVVEEKNREIEMYRVRTVALIEQGKRYKHMIDRLIGEFGLKSEIQQTMKEKVLYNIIYTCVKYNFKKVLNIKKYIYTIHVKIRQKVFINIYIYATDLQSYDRTILDLFYTNYIMMRKLICNIYFSRW